MSVVVIGQIGRDLVLRTDGPPAPGHSTTILERKELLGGKGANQAVGRTRENWLHESRAVPRLPLSWADSIGQARRAAS